jgi:hypothetical protein
VTLRSFAVDDGMGGHQAGRVATHVDGTRDNLATLVVRDEAD